MQVGLTSSASCSQANIRLKSPRMDFNPFHQDGMELLVATASNVEITLSVSSVQQEIIVNSEAAVLVNTTDATLGNAFAEKQVVHASD